MVSVERVLNYCKVPQEARLDSDPANKPPDDWPSKGNIEVSQNLDDHASMFASTSTYR